MNDDGSSHPVVTVHGTALDGRVRVAIVDVGVALVTAALLVMTALGLTGIVRTLLALALVSFVPGWALLGHIRLAEGQSMLALAVALSLTISTAAALILLLLRMWQPYVLLYATGTLSLIGVVSHLARRDDSPLTSLIRRRATPAKGPT